METRARRVMALTALLSTSMIMNMSNVTTAQADWVHGNAQTSSVATTGAVATCGQVITVMVSGSGYKGGSSGSGGGGQFSVGVPAPCWMMAAETGSAHYQWAASGQVFRDMRHSGGQRRRQAGIRGAQERRQGSVVGPSMRPGELTQPQRLLRLWQVADQFFAANLVVYVQVTQTPPAPSVTPESLRGSRSSN